MLRDLLCQGYRDRAPAGSYDDETYWHRSNLPPAQPIQAGVGSQDLLYLLRNFTFARANQVWAMEIT